MKTEELRRGEEKAREARESGRHALINNLDRSNADTARQFAQCRGAQAHVPHNADRPHVPQ